MRDAKWVDILLYELCYCVKKLLTFLHEQKHYLTTPICFEKFQVKLIMEAFEQKLSVASDKVRERRRDGWWNLSQRPSHLCSLASFTSPSASAFHEPADTDERPGCSGLRGLWR